MNRTGNRLRFLHQLATHTREAKAWVGSLPPDAEFLYFGKRYRVLGTVGELRVGGEGLRIRLLDLGTGKPTPNCSLLAFWRKAVLLAEGEPLTGD